MEGEIEALEQQVSDLVARLKLEIGKRDTLNDIYESLCDAAVDDPAAGTLAAQKIQEMLAIDAAMRGLKKKIVPLEARWRQLKAQRDGAALEEAQESCRKEAQAAAEEKQERLRENARAARDKRDRIERDLADAKKLAEIAQADYLKAESELNSHRRIKIDVLATEREIERHNQVGSELEALAQKSLEHRKSAFQARDSLFHEHLTASQAFFQASEVLRLNTPRSAPSGKAWIA